MSTRSPAVLAAEARRRRQRTRLKYYGRWDPWRDAEPVRVYVRSLMKKHGMASHVIANACGVSTAVIDNLLYAKGKQARTTRLRTENAEKIMAYRPTLDDYPDAADYDATGSRRRLQALATLGWTRPALAARKGIHVVRLTTIMVAGTKMTSAATARIVRDLYDELWHRSPTEDEVPAWVRKRTQNDAATKRWNGPLAWDDDTIDDRRTKPRRGRSDDNGGVDMAKVMRRLEGEKLTLGAWENTAAIDYGIRIRGLSFEAVAELLDMEYESMKRTWERIKERARDAGEKWPNSPRWTDPALTTPTDVQRAA
ncbi:hypothetical protein ACUXZZ_45185 (plasmid) [Streptomyces graminifolii]|uniref:hypothetical protein n=1 Tax=Streptomyces graminifolii TaxID=1266771 RepID=UPI00405845BE